MTNAAGFYAFHVVISLSAIKDLSVCVCVCVEGIMTCSEDILLPPPSPPPNPLVLSRSGLYRGEGEGKGRVVSPHSAEFTFFPLNSSLVLFIITLLFSLHLVSVLFCHRRRGKAPPLFI